MYFCGEMNKNMNSSLSSSISGVKEAWRGGGGDKEESLSVRGQAAEQRARLHQSLEPHLWCVQERYV